MAPTMEATRTRSAGTGVAMALVSAATFGSSGPFAKSLLDAGWSAGAAVLVRMGGAAVVLVVAATIGLRGRWRPTGRSVRTLVVFGTVAVAGAQLSFFNAVRTLDVGVALLLEFLAPVMLLAWTALRTRRRPNTPTLVGAGMTLVGLAFVLELGGASSVDPAGVAWGLLAALCLCGFFVMSARQDVAVPPVVMAAGGTAVGAVVVAIAGLVGLVPLAFSTEDAVLAGAQVSWLVPVLPLVLLSTVTAYLTGIGAVRRLGVRVASFVGLTEVLFAVVTAAVLVAQMPGLSQLAGGVLIVGGIVVIRRHEVAELPVAAA
ncbi:EamA family transporter [Nitriliruptor alkaliphilus]|uniref:EamA family transporter n=1 Tax=Nitriliruptor alkaliphilus TaxID=427918 RepID=UPI000AFE118F|nr:DMT family transporter [Nitriliruptor alkaliphilus]